MCLNLLVQTTELNLGHPYQVCKCFNQQLLHKTEDYRFFFFFFCLVVLRKKAQNTTAISTEFSNFSLKGLLAQALCGFKWRIDYFLVPYLASIQISCADSYANTVITKTVVPGYCS